MRVATIDPKGGTSVEIGARREGNRSQVGHVARISDKVWRRFSALLWHESPIQDTRCMMSSLISSVPAGSDGRGTLGGAQPARHPRGYAWASVELRSVAVGLHETGIASDELGERLGFELGE